MRQGWYQYGAAHTQRPQISPSVVGRHFFNVVHWRLIDSNAIQEPTFRLARSILFQSWEGYLKKPRLVSNRTPLL